MSELILLCDVVPQPDRVASMVTALTHVGCTVRVMSLADLGCVKTALRQAAVSVRRARATSPEAQPRTYFVPLLASRDKQCEVVRMLENWNVPTVGCRHRQFMYDQEDVVMMSCYSEVPMPNFVVVDGSRPRDAQHVAKLRFPVAIRGTEECALSPGIVVGTQDAVEAALDAALCDYPRVFVTECLSAQRTTVRLLVAAFGPGQPLWVASDAPSEHAAAVEGVAAPIAANILTHTGNCEVLLSLCQATGTVMLLNVHLGFDLWDPIALEASSYAQLIERLIANSEAMYAANQPSHVVVFDATTKGYHLRAAHNIRKGDVVFQDEGRTFAIVTKDHVRSTWSDEDKVTFTRYAWPLDGNGHVYAIWEENPKRWRPINHSCDPTCVNAAPHSLNVIATRDISEGEDLTMDYATFCDFTMKPFQCHCGSSVCRGLIQPDDATLNKYQLHTWHRTQPNPNGGL